MGFLVNTYYFLLLVYSFGSVYYLLNGFDIELENIEVGKLSSDLIKSILLWIPYILLILLGLLSSQWYLFFSVILSTFLFYFISLYVENETALLILERTSIFIEISLVVFICLNYFHFGLNLLNFLF